MGPSFFDVAAADREAAQGARDPMAKCLRSGKPLQSSRQMVFAMTGGIVDSNILVSSAIPRDLLQ